MDYEINNPELEMDYEIDDAELESEFFPCGPQTDTIFVLDGRGRMVRLEVPDDD